MKKKQLAQKMLTKIERKRGVSPFMGKNWQNRAEARKKKELAKQGIKYEPIIID